jgi:hypothetical protein
MFRFFFAAVAALCFTVPAQAQNFVANKLDYYTLCHRQRTDGQGCELLRNSKVVPGISLIRFYAATLAKASNNARDPDTQVEATTLLAGLQDELDSHQKIKKRFHVGPLPLGGTNAGVVIETAWLSRLNQCASGQRSPCAMLSAEGRANLKKGLRLLGNVYPEYQKAWVQMLMALEHA